MKGRIEREEGMCSVLASTGMHDVQAGGGLHCVREREIYEEGRQAGRQQPAEAWSALQAKEYISDRASVHSTFQSKKVSLAASFSHTYPPTILFQHTYKSHIIYREMIDITNATCTYIHDDPSLYMHVSKYGYKYGATTDLLDPSLYLLAAGSTLPPYVSFPSLLVIWYSMTVYVLYDSYMIFTKKLYDIHTSTKKLYDILWQYMYQGLGFFLVLGSYQVWIEIGMEAIIQYVLRLEGLCKHKT
jgi:hypothetical protein